MKWYENYKSAIKYTGMKLPAPLMIVLALFFSSAVLAGTVLFFDITLGILIAFLIFDIFLGLPFYLENKKIKQIEKALPDVLHHMSTTLKTGGTVESSLKEAIRLNYGPITDGLKLVTKEINEGKSFEDAFKHFAILSKSELLKKSAVIIIAARKSGGGLVDTLSAMAEDIREIYQLRKERTDKTFLQFLFIVVAGSIITPFVFGILRTVLTILFSASASLEGADAGLLGQFEFLFKTYLIVESSLTTLGAVQVKEGKISSGVILIPVMAIIAYVTYILTATMFGALIGI